MVRVYVSRLIFALVEAAIADLQKKTPWTSINFEELIVCLWKKQMILLNLRKTNY